MGAVGLAWPIVHAPADTERSAHRPPFIQSYQKSGGLLGDLFGFERETGSKGLIAFGVRVRVDDTNVQ